MIGVGIFVAWAGFTVGIWGYCLVRGYDVPFSGLFHATWPGGVTGQQPFQPGTNPSSGITLT